MPPGRKTAKTAKPKTEPRLDPKASGLTASEADRFRAHLRDWYLLHARKLPWRGVDDPYRTWVSEIMLQQTRVAAVIDPYTRFLRLFPSVARLAAASEESVLAAWSGLGYYRRARMFHKAAQFIVQEFGGTLPGTATQLRTLPGIGEYTAAAIASICFGESIAVVDGNVERVLLRVTGRPEEATAAARAFVARQAAALVPKSDATATENPPGDHNQAMMELGATLCLPRAPLCLQCPVVDLCRTRGEHLTPPRTRQRSRTVAYLFSTRRRGARVQVLLECRDPNAGLMPGMYELPPLPLEAVAAREPILRLRHSITDTNYYVEIYAEETTEDRALSQALPAAPADLSWQFVARLGELPLTGLARKVLQRIDILAVGGLNTPSSSIGTSA